MNAERFESAGRHSTPAGNGEDTRQVHITVARKWHAAQRD
jgi:hypothetical protein